MISRSSSRKRLETADGEREPAGDGKIAVFTNDVTPGVGRPHRAKAS